MVFNANIMNERLFLGCLGCFLDLCQEGEDYEHERFLIETIMDKMLTLASRVYNQNIKRGSNRDVFNEEG